MIFNPTLIGLSVIAAAIFWLNHKIKPRKEKRIAFHEGNLIHYYVCPAKKCKSCPIRFECFTEGGAVEVSFQKFAALKKNKLFRDPEREFTIPK